MQLAEYEISINRQLASWVKNRGSVNPMTAAEIAQAFDIRIYTIGVGSHTPYTQIDEELLQEISEMTGGLYYRAADNDDLQMVFDEIDQLEKSVSRLANETNGS